ncbi:MAG: hypothetical protein DMG30_19265 [Acidobacteria bacterium]|nr:MAG: hypothetical protein DMG30_19265 [Acidobacteriota bacterium]
MITNAGRVYLRLIAALVVVLAMSTAKLYVEAQVQPTNSLPKTYRTIETRGSTRSTISSARSDLDTTIKERR